MLNSENTKFCAAPLHLALSIAERTGLEPATSYVTGRRSNQLNYHSKMTMMKLGRELLFFFIHHCPCGPEGNRTPDLLNAIQALYQLSYEPGHAVRLLLHRHSAFLRGRTNGIAPIAVPRASAFTSYEHINFGKCLCKPSKWDWRQSSVGLGAKFCEDLLAKKMPTAHGGTRSARPAISRSKLTSNTFTRTRSEVARAEIRFIVVGSRRVFVLFEFVARKKIVDSISDRFDLK